jgi:ribulose 1,5-bisphosphate carboxylase large subunit-like protein
MKNDKEEQKQHLIDMMKDDENLGLYEESKLRAVETIVEIQSEMIERYKKITELDKEHLFCLENLIQTQEKLISNLKHQVELLEKLYL